MGGEGSWEHHLGVWATSLANTTLHGIRRQKSCSPGLSGPCMLSPWSGRSVLVLLQSINLPVHQGRFLLLWIWNVWNEAGLTWASWKIIGSIFLLSKTFQRIEILLGTPSYVYLSYLLCDARNVVRQTKIVHIFAKVESMSKTIIPFWDVQDNLY